MYLQLPPLYQSNHILAQCFHMFLCFMTATAGVEVDQAVLAAFVVFGYVYFAKAAVAPVVVGERRTSTSHDKTFLQSRSRIRTNVHMEIRRLHMAPPLKQCYSLQIQNQVAYIKSTFLSLRITTTFPSQYPTTVYHIFSLPSPYPIYLSSPSPFLI